MDKIRLEGDAGGVAQREKRLVPLGIGEQQQPAGDQAQEPQN